jgi:hypothetical protein
MCVSHYLAAVQAVEGVAGPHGMRSSITFRSQPGASKRRAKLESPGFRALATGSRNLRSAVGQPRTLLHSVSAHAVHNCTRINSNSNRTLAPDFLNKLELSTQSFQHRRLNPIVGSWKCRRHSLETPVPAARQLDAVLVEHRSDLVDLYCATFHGFAVARRRTQT